MGTYYDFSFFFGKQEGGKKVFKNYSLLTRKNSSFSLALASFFGDITPDGLSLSDEFIVFSHPPITCSFFGPEKNLWDDVL